MEELKERKAAVLDQITQAAHLSQRSPNEITLIAVTKTWPIEVILAAYEAGLRHFGENRTFELAEKRPLIEAQLGQDSGIQWHFIGHLQSRKAKEVAQFADTFHALDRVKIAKKLQTHLGEINRRLNVFIEVNVSGEMSKSGVLCSQWENDATQQADLRKVAKAVLDAPNLKLVGIMTMAPWGAPPSDIKTIFSRTRQLARWLENDVKCQRPLNLSMGMTDDFDIAISEGATHIRVGRALFGDRRK